jgi:hypothetical protein
MGLISVLKAINKEIGLRLEERSLYPKLNLDAYLDVTPILVKRGKGHGFGVEDMFVVGPKHGINITR